jgi:hypothetical protein
VGRWPEEQTCTLDIELVLPPEHGGTRCRVEVYGRGSARPIIILTELDDNPGLPISVTLCKITGAVLAMIPVGVEPHWIEQWRGRALASVIKGRQDVTTFMTVDPHSARGRREPVHPAFVLALRGGGR